MKFLTSPPLAGVDGLYKGGGSTTVVDAHITFTLDAPDTLIQDALAKLRDKFDALYDQSTLQSQWGLLNSAQVRVTNGYC